MNSGTKRISIVFFGSGPVAAKSLSFLDQHFSVEAVITKPATKVDMARLSRAPVHTVTTKLELDELISKQSFASRVGIIVDFGIIVSQIVIDAFPLGIVNSHFSLLPRWRGADPISFAILNGDTKTGVSLMVIEPTLDSGKLITQKSLPINPAETTPELTERLIALSNELLCEYLPRYVSGDISPKNQPHPERATYSRKLTKEDGIIDWHKPAAMLEREIRAFAGWPKSHALVAGKEVIVLLAHITDLSGPAGQAKVHNGQLVVLAGQQALIIDEIKPAGKKAMPGADFIRGYGQNL